MLIGSPCLRHGFLCGGGGGGGGYKYKRDSSILDLFAKKKIDQEIQNEMPVTLSGSTNRHYILKVVLRSENIYKAVSPFLMHDVKIQ